MIKILSKIARFVLFAAVVLVTLAALVLAGMNFAGKRAWDAYKREAAARGAKLETAQFVPPPVPDDQNFAMTPLLKPLFAEDRSYESKLANELDLKPKKAGTTNSLGGMWKAERVNLDKWREALGSRDLLEALKKYDPQLDEISRALSRPESRFPLDYSAGYGMNIPHFKVLMNLQRLYCLRALAELDAGQTDRAYSDLMTMFGLCRISENEPVLISQLVRISSQGLAIQVLWEGLAAHQWSDEQLVAIQGQLDGIDLLDGMRRAIEFERAMGAESWIKMVNDPKALQTLIGMQNKAVSLPGGLWVKATKFQNAVQFCEFFDRYLLPGIDGKARCVDAPLFEKGEASLDPLWEKNEPTDGRVIFSGKLLTALTAPSILGIGPKLACAQTKADTALVACALERYRMAKNSYPETLDALVPQYLAKLPHDVIGCAPLHYRRTGDGQFILYSVGWNGLDDNGLTGATEKGAQDFKKGDWVWRYPATR